MLATARLTGQTIGATLTAILFRFDADGPALALALGAVFAVLGALASVSRLAGGAPTGASSRA
jgi:DHA2 family multidrug resistance protein-like MFS transporter